MEIKSVDEFIKEIINDRRIFFYYPGAQLFNKGEMVNLKEKFEKDKLDAIKQIEDKKAEIEKDLRSLKELMSNTRDRREKRRLDNQIKNRQKCIHLSTSMIKAVRDTPYILEEQFNMLSDFGTLSTNLPKGALDDIGRLIEETEPRIVEEFILYKIQKERDRNKERALRILLDYIKQLYRLNLTLPEKGFIIRKLDALKLFPEVINYD